MFGLFFEKFSTPKLLDENRSLNFKNKIEAALINLTLDRKLNFFILLRYPKSFQPRKIKIEHEQILGVFPEKKTKKSPRPI